MAKLWQADDEVYKTMRDLIAKHHPHLAAVDKEIAIVFKEKATEIGTVVISGKTGKAPPLFAVLGETPWKFIITLAADVWNDFKDKERVALLDHHLCGCRADEDPETGEPKCYVAPPDVAFYRGEIERHGMWRTSQAAPTPNLLAEIFGS